MTSDPEARPATAAAPSLARNALSLYGVRGLVALTALGLTPYLYRQLGPGGFGTWSVLLTLTMIFDLLEFGFASGPSKLVAAHHARRDRRAQDAVLGATLILMTVLGLAGLLGALVLALTADGLAAEGQGEAFRTGLLVIGFAGVIRMSTAAYGATLMGLQRWDLFNVAEGIKVLGFLVAAIAVTEAGAGVVGLAWAFGGSWVVSGLLQAVLLRRADPHARLLPRRTDRRALREVGSFSSLTLLADSMVFAGQRADTIVIAALAGARAAGPYAAVVRLQSGVQALTLPFLRLLLPMASQLAAQSDFAGVRRQLLLASRLTLQITLPVAMAFAIFSPDIVSVWLGGGTPDSTVWVVVALMGVQVLGLTANAAERVLVGIGRVRLLAAMAVAEGLSNLVVSIVLVSAIGALGAAIGTLASTMVFAPLKLPIALRTLHTPSWGRALAGALVPPVFASAPAIVAMVAIRLGMEEGPLRLVVGLTVGISLALAVAVRQFGPQRVRTAITRSIVSVWRTRRR